MPLSSRVTTEGKPQAISTSARAPAGPRGAALDRGDDDIADVRGGVEVAERAVGELARELEHPRAVGGDEDPHRPFGRRHLELEAPDREHVALEGHALAGEERPKDREQLAHRLDRALVRAAVPVLDVVARLDADPELQPPGEELQRRSLQRELSPASGSRRRRCPCRSRSAIV